MPQDKRKQLALWFGETAVLVHFDKEDGRFPFCVRSSDALHFGHFDGHIPKVDKKISLLALIRLTEDA